MTTETLAEQSESSVVDELVKRARSLYSLPAVAAEVIQLTNNPKVDARALKDCIQSDPALTAKLLRVVNSSLFGLSREVTDLNQTLALLGTKPLKLLVLGFSLPESLFSEVAREQLEWYWSTTLTRAVAAKEISEQLFDRPGDDAFLAGLFQDIGVLVLLGELKEPYAKFLSGVIEQKVDLRRLEVDSLGFDHLQLTAALLEHWNMPKLLVEAISEPRDPVQLAKRHQEQATLAKIVHLAELVAELVGRNRLRILPDLMETGDAYCQLDKQQLNDLVETLQPKVRQLADVLSLEFTEETDYSDIIREAHLQMSQIAEDAVIAQGQQSQDEEQAYSNLLADANSLHSAVDNFLNFSSSPTTSVTSKDASAASNAVPAQRESQANGLKQQDQKTVATVDFDAQLTFAIGSCRSKRQPVSLLLLDISGKSSEDALGRQLLGQMLDKATGSIDVADAVGEAPHDCRRVIVLPNVDRHEAVRLSEEMIGKIENMAQRIELKGTHLEFAASAGVSSVALPPKNFPPEDLLESAQRCLKAAQDSGANIVKSLEIY